jgi:hypothetical protein
MDDPPDREQARRQPAVTSGLCASCVHARVIASDRGSRFLLCERSKTDPSYRRFPPLPVVRCEGHET